MAPARAAFAASTECCFAIPGLNPPTTLSRTHYGLQVVSFTLQNHCKIHWRSFIKAGIIIVRRKGAVIRLHLLIAEYTSPFVSIITRGGISCELSVLHRFVSGISKNIHKNVRLKWMNKRNGSTAKLLKITEVCFTTIRRKNNNGSIPYLENVGALCSTCFVQVSTCLQYLRSYSLTVHRRYSHE